MESFPEKKLTRMLSLMGELCGVLKKENDLLKNQRQEECRDLMDSKTKLSMAYEEAFDYFVQRKNLLAGLPEKQKRVLRKASVMLGDLTTENARLLKINIDATQRLLTAIAQDIESQNNLKAPLYTKKGAMEADHGNPAAISFNQVL